MYAAGDKIIYGSNGVCTVVEICTPNLSRAEWGKQYYKLRPVYGTEIIYAPLDTKAFIRPVMTREEAETLIGRMKEIEGQVCESHSVTALRQQYEDILRSRDCEGYIKLIKGVHSKEQGGKKLGQTDQRYMKRAEEILHSELAVALEITPTEVPAYIQSLLEES